MKDKVTHAQMYLDSVTRLTRILRLELEKEKPNGRIVDKLKLRITDNLNKYYDYIIYL